MGAVSSPVATGITIRNILFPTDFSLSSELALPYATTLARRYGAGVYLAHVLPPEAPIPFEAEPLPAEYDSERRDAERHMARLLSADVLSGIHAQAEMQKGELWTVLGDVVQRCRIDLIVSGTHGREGVSKLILGSTAEQIFRQSPVPVLMIGPSVAPDLLAQGRFARVMFATDLSPASMAALPMAISMAQENRAELVLLHIVHPAGSVPVEFDAGDLTQQLCASAEARLNEIAQQCGVNARGHVEVGFALEGILRNAAEMRASLIVLGVRPTAPRMRSHIPWAIAHRVVCEARCPVLTVREQA